MARNFSHYNEELLSLKRREKKLSHYYGKMCCCEERVADENTQFIDVTVVLCSPRLSTPAITEACSLAEIMILMAIAVNARHAELVQ